MSTDLFTVICHVDSLLIVWEKTTRVSQAPTSAVQSSATASATCIFDMSVGAGCTGSYLSPMEWPIMQSQPRLLLTFFLSWVMVVAIVIACVSSEAILSAYLSLTRMFTSTTSRSIALIVTRPCLRPSGKITRSLMTCKMLLIGSKSRQLALTKWLL